MDVVNVANATAEADAAKVANATAEVDAAKVANATAEVDAAKVANATAEVDAAKVSNTTIGYWKLVVSSLLQPSMLLLFQAAALRQTGTTNPRLLGGGVLITTPLSACIRVAVTWSAVHGQGKRS